MPTANSSITRYAWLAIATAIATIALKTAAYLLTDSVGLLSDALESVVNLVAAIAALAALVVAAREPDEEHAYGHGKAEYFSSGLEGFLILIAALLIAWTAIPRLIDPVALESVGLGVIVSTAASVLNFGVARVLLRASQRHRSITLEASGKHLLTDVWTSVGVLVAVVAVAISGWARLDAILALIVAANILWTAVGLIRRSMLGLLDTAIPAEEIAVVNDVLDRYRQPGIVETHALRTRQAASRRFVSFHVLVTSDWSIAEGHTLVEQIEHDIRVDLPNTTVFTHLEPIDDPVSWADDGLDRPEIQHTN
jgi:cation diffusion facilitator family transporter